MTHIVDTHVHVPADAALAPRMVLSLRANGVGRAIVAGLGRGRWPADPTDTEVAETNLDAFALCADHPDLLRAYVYLNPNGAWRRELARWDQSPFFAGVKLWISLRDAEGRDDVCQPVLERAAEQGFCVLVHSFFRAGANLPGELNPARVAALAARVPDARVIMAHLGGSWEKGLKTVADVANLYVDVSGGPASRGCVECAVRHCGPERVLFGSDLPCRTVQSQLAKVQAAAIPDAQKQHILAQNALRLFARALARGACSGARRVLWRASRSRLNAPRRTP